MNSNLNTIEQEVHTRHACQQLDLAQYRFFMFSCLSSDSIEAESMAISNDDACQGQSLEYKHELPLCSRLEGCGCDLDNDCDMHPTHTAHIQDKGYNPQQHYTFDVLMATEVGCERLSVGSQVPLSPYTMQLLQQVGYHLSAEIKSQL